MKKPTKTQLSEWGRMMATLRKPKHMVRGDSAHYARLAQMRKP